MVRKDRPAKMTQNMFQEGLYHVFFKDSPRTSTKASSSSPLTNARIHRWFGTVVNTRLLVSGVVQIICGFACILTTVTHACVSYSCSVSMSTPVWSSLFFMAAGCLAVEVQRKANKLKIIGLMGLNVFSLLFGFSALLANSLVAKQPVALSTDQQRVGSYVAKGSSVTFTVKCFLASIYILFISWRGLQRYSTPVIQVYSQISQDPDGPLLEDEELDL
ncbi:transmembrane protein 253 isoform X1 [Takifugu rubripes]|uniref:Si:dkey-30c15.13 n=1 Tax=Takifugu rubripes TaxID=31033 RepID=A0A3B5KAU7_TAKRU|nr:membrane-spanning 4-domains subfamily A member 18-like isoform X1 [Takifugu rubripes]